MTMPQMSSELGELARLAVQMEDLAQRVMGASENVPDEVTVVDGTESLLITMRRDGSVEDFQMESDWKDSIEPDDLGDALTMFLGEAQYELMSGFDEALVESYDGPQEDEGDESINFLTDPRVREFEAGWRSSLRTLVPTWCPWSRRARTRTPISTGCARCSPTPPSAPAAGSPTAARR